jgi:hypothetical protein
MSRRRNPKPTVGTISSPTALYIYLMDPQAKFVNVIQGNEAGEDIAAWLRKEMSGSKR